MSTTIETPTPTFQRRTARGHAQELDTPLPPTVVGIADVREAAERHRELAGGSEPRSRSSRPRTRSSTAAEAADRERRIAAARTGRQAPSQRATMQARAKVEEATALLDALAESLTRSADELLGIAAPHFQEATAAASEAHVAAVDRGRSLVAAAIEEFSRAGQLATEREWIVAASGRTRRSSPSGLVPVIRRSCNSALVSGSSSPSSTIDGRRSR